MCLILGYPWATQSSLQASLSLCPNRISRLAWLSLVTTRSLSFIHIFMYVLIYPFIHSPT